jgi:hypothetical protein
VLEWAAIDDEMKETFAELMQPSMRSRTAISSHWCFRRSRRQRTRTTHDVKAQPSARAVRVRDVPPTKRGRRLFSKTFFRREYAELIYGANVFANDPWELLRRRSAARDICRTVTPAKSALPVRPSTNHGFLGKIPGYAV